MAVSSKQPKDDTAMLTIIAVKNAKPRKRQYID
jgi:hypothetical protein